MGVVGLLALFILSCTVIRIFETEHLALIHTHSPSMRFQSVAQIYEYSFYIGYDGELNNTMKLLCKKA